MDEGMQAGFAAALDAARFALAAKEAPIGAAYFSGACLCSSAHTMTHKKRSPLQHAEIVALATATFPAEPVDEARSLFTTVEPCLMCFGAALNAGIKNIGFLLLAAGDGCYRMVKSVQDHKPADPLSELIGKVEIRFGNGDQTQQALRLMKEFVSGQPDHPDRPYAQAVVRANERAGDG
jgi:tRNA(adenine34) deaminase